MPMSLISETDAWRVLEQLRDQMRGVSLDEMFRADPRRAENHAVDLGDLYVDYSRQHLNEAVMAALERLAEAADLAGFLHRMVTGDAVNISEDRAALHSASRGTDSGKVPVSDAISATDARLQSFVAAVHDGTIKDASGKPFRAVVAIGIGGSELGPNLVLDALREGLPKKLDVRFCGNIDGIAFSRAFGGLDPSETLVVVISKSFTTSETAANAEGAKRWMQAGVGEDWAENFAVVSANVQAASKFGVAPDRVFPMWDWVGGRYSLWSAVGLPVALAYGWSAFAAIRDGARQMDQHMLNAPLRENAPVMMALLTVWNASFMGYGAEACVPYDTRLSLLVDHLQQLEMESNGKRVTQSGRLVDYATQPIVFGGIGVNSQHAFFQQLHQGTTAAPVDFLIPAKVPEGEEAFRDMLAAAALAQADALAFGRENNEQPHRHYPGNRPSTLIIYKDMNPVILGKLIALYEHKTAAAAAIWGINPFDQWGVELGKTLSAGIRPMLSGKEAPTPSLAPVIAAIRRMRTP